ncbi:MAG: hypothetical protein IKC69_05845, partial [Clostridia bacterium]|nr:hypothetical protein [Clostridia bacterium]
VFYKKNYQSDLYKAIEEEDDVMTAHIMRLLMGERLSEDMDEAVYNELLDLSKKGQKVLPKSIPASITIDEEEYELTDEEYTAIRDVYSTSQESLKSLFANQRYNALSDEQKTAAVDYVYDAYYDRAMYEVLGVGSVPGDALVTTVIGVDNLALLSVFTKGLAGDKDEQGMTISGSKRKKVVSAIRSLGLSKEKTLLLICAKGYSLQDNDVPGLSAEAAKKYLLRYILKLKVSKLEKAALAELCGFEVKNGRIVTQSL